MGFGRTVWTCSGLAPQPPKVSDSNSPWFAMAITRSEQGEANTFKSKEDLLCFTKTFWLAVSGLASSLFSREPVWISELKIFIAIYAMWVPFTHSKTPATPLHPHCNAALPAFRSHTRVEKNVIIQRWHLTNSSLTIYKRFVLIFVAFIWNTHGKNPQEIHNWLFQRFNNIAD